MDVATLRALEVFWAQGYERTSIPDLVEATGVQRGSLYAAYGSKHGLYLAALDRYQVEASTPMGLAVQQVLQEGRPVRSAVRELLVSLVDQAVEDPQRRGCLMVNAVTERADCDRDVAKRGREAMAGMTEAFSELLAVARDRGELGEDRDIAALAGFLVLTVQGLRIAGMANPDRVQLTAAVDIAVAALQ